MNSVIKKLDNVPRPGDPMGRVGLGSYNSSLMFFMAL